MSFEEYEKKAIETVHFWVKKEKSGITFSKSIFESDLEARVGGKFCSGSFVSDWFIDFAGKQDNEDIKNLCRRLYHNDNKVKYVKNHWIHN